jgi:hypothetical protein
VGTHTLADAELPADTSGTPGPIGERACVTAVDPSGEDGADRTGHKPRWRGHGQRQPRGRVVELPRVEWACGGLRSEA